MVTDAEYEVVWPRGRTTARTVDLATRLDGLQGKTVCALWDMVFRGDQIYGFLHEELKKRYPGVQFVGHEAFGSIHGGNEAEVLASLPGKLKQNRCDAVVSGIGC